MLLPLRHRPTVSPLTIPLVYCHIKSFQRASGVERPLPGGEKRRGGRASPHEEWCSDGVVSPPVCDHRAVPDRGVVPDWCTSSGSAMDACSDPSVWARRAERAADGGVVDVPRALSVLPRAPRIHAQRGARFDPSNTRNCLPPKKLRQRYSRYMIRRIYSGSIRTSSQRGKWAAHVTEGAAYAACRSPAPCADPV
jgi:hypothetical protein